MFAHLRRHCLLWKTMVWLEFTLWERTDLPNKKIGPRVSLNLLISTDWPCSYFQTQFSRTGPALSPLGMNTAPGSRSFSGRFFEAASATAAATWVFPVPAARPGASRCATFSKCHDAIWPHLVALAPNCISWTWWSPTARGFMVISPKAGDSLKDRLAMLKQTIETIHHQCLMMNSCENQARTWFEARFDGRSAFKKSLQTINPAGELPNKAQ